MRCELLLYKDIIFTSDSRRFLESCATSAKTGAIDTIHVLHLVITGSNVRQLRIDIWVLVNYVCGE